VSLTYLLDTNIISKPLRPAPNLQVLERLKRYEDETGCMVGQQRDEERAWGVRLRSQTVS
jgi:predicted nucleic acid-binding protein